MSDLSVTVWLTVVNIHIGVCFMHTRTCYSFPPPHLATLEARTLMFILILMIIILIH